MNVPTAELALGTVQFGLKYGVAGRGEPVPESEVREIVALAWRGGIRTLDTASAYGDIEERLAALVDGYEYTIVSKIPALPQAIDAAVAAAAVRESVARIRARLGERVRTILFHRSDDLMGPDGDVIWQAAVEATCGAQLRLGVSCYSPADAAAVAGRFPIGVVQLPGNALDQRLLTGVPLAGLEVHLRSVFLQGLLLLPASAAALRVPKAASAIARWHRWCEERGLSPLSAALGIAKALPGVRYCVVGVDRPAQMEEIMAAWRAAEPIQAPVLGIEGGDVIDPRRW